MPKRLDLKRETVGELTATELAGVAGGAPPTLVVRECLPSGHTCVDCLTRWC